MTSPPSACERLAQSRERLRQAIHDVSSAPQEGCHQRTDHGRASASEWWGMLNTIPGAQVLVGIFQDWWGKPSLREVLSLAADAAKVALQPLAQRHPYGLVLGAAVAGGLFVFVRPWRLVSTSSLVAGLLPQVLAEVMKFMPDQARAAPQKRSAPDDVRQAATR